MKAGQGYCVRCRKVVDMKNAKKKKSKTGRNMLQGLCGKCGTKVTVFTK